MMFCSPPTAPARLERDDDISVALAREDSQFLAPLEVLPKVWDWQAVHGLDRWLGRLSSNARAFPTRNARNTDRVVPGSKGCQERRERTVALADDCKINAVDGSDQLDAHDAVEVGP